jgi:NAD(P)-dependent dehydrogenase (short-subunit alcohol dehydrogenase family)
MEDLVGKTAVVTGAASGMGKAFAVRFAKAGMNVVLSDVDEVGVAAVAAEISANHETAGATVITHRTDVRHLDSVQSLADVALAAFGQVNVLCNNAGVASKFLGGQIDVADWQWVMDVNFWGVVYGHKVFLPHLMEHGDGHIVNTASMAGHFPSHSPYGASKWAVVGITEGLFHMLADMKSTVGVSCLCPGWVNTSIADSVDRRPEDVAPGVQLEDSPQDEARYAFVKELVRNGLSPDFVADQVHDAVLAKQFWILTHPEMVASLPARYDSILQGTNPPRTMI